MALPVLLLRGKHKDGAVLTEPHVDTAVGAAAALFEIHAEPETAKPPLALGFRATRLETGHIGTGQCRFHQFRHLAAIDGTAAHHCKGYLVGADQVAAPYLDAVDTDMLGDVVHQPFHHIIGLGPSGTAIGIDGRGVRHNPENAKAGNGNGIVCGQRARSRQGRDIGAEVGKPRPHIGVNRDGQGVDFAGLVDDRARLCPVVTAVKVRHETVGTGLLPADAAPDPACGPGDDQLFRVKENLETEAATDIAGAHTHLVARHAERLGDLFGNADRPLRSAPDVYASSLFAGAGDHRARLHRIDDHPVVDHVNVEQFHALRLGSGNGGVGGLVLSLYPVEGDVVRIFLIELRRAILDRGIDIRDRGHAVVTRIDQLHRVLRDAVGLGHDHRDDVPRRAVDVADHGRVRDHGHLLAILVGQAMLAFDFTHLVGVEVGLGRHKQHAVERRRGTGVDGQKARMRKRCAKKRDTKPGSGLDIIRVTPAPRDQSWVLNPWNWLANTELHAATPARGLKICR